MFILQRDDTVRVHVDVPQSAAAGLEDGLSARVSVPEIPNQVFTGVLARSAGALSIASRTLSVEIDLHNDAHTLRPGQFVYVTFAIPRARPTVVVAASAILFNGKGLRVATVSTDHSVQMHAVTIARDFGTTAELREGLAGGERIIVNPPANLKEGAMVRIVEERPSPQ